MIIVVFGAAVALPVVVVADVVDFVDVHVAVAAVDVAVYSPPDDSFPYRYRDRREQRHRCWFVRPSLPACVWDFGGACVGAAAVLIFWVWIAVALVAPVVVAVVCRRRRRRFADGSFPVYFSLHFPLLLHRGQR